MAVALGKPVPDFDAVTTIGNINFYDYIKDSWAILFSHPRDFTPVCTTELGTVASLLPEFQKRNVKVIALSCDDVDSHNAWIADINNAPWCAKTGAKVTYPIIDDAKREIAVKYGMIEPENKDAGGLPLTCRAVFIIGPDRCLKLSLLYPASVGRNFDEIIRVVDALQLTAKHNVATPVNWKVGDDVIVPPSVSNDAAREKFGSYEAVAVPSGKEYLRVVKLN